MGGKLLGLGIGLSTEDISGPSHIYCVGLREFIIVDSKYLRFGFMRSFSFTYLLRCGVESEKINIYIVCPRYRALNKRSDTVQ